MIDADDEPTMHSCDPRISFSIQFLEKQLFSPFEHPLAGRVKSGIRKHKDMRKCTSKKQVEGDMLMSSNVDNHHSATSITTSGGPREKQKRCRRHLVRPFEPLGKEYVKSCNSSVFLGQGGLSNFHSGTIVHRHHHIQDEHQVEYKRLKIDFRNEDEAHGNSWLG